MRLLFLGDIMGRSGRTVVDEHLPGLREQLGLDLVIINGENAAAGFGLTERTAQQLLDAGADVISGGNHSFDQKEISAAMKGESRILRPCNYPKATPGRGHIILQTARGKKVLVINVMGQVGMHPVLANPFHAVDDILATYKIGQSVDAIMVDVHAEATSEKMAMGQYLDGKVSFVVGTHTHIPTADTQILPNGTAYQTDAGMCGDYDSVIGMEKDEPIYRFITRQNRQRFSPAMGPATLCGVFVEIDDNTGLATRAEPVRVGGRLAPQMPVV